MIDILLTNIKKNNKLYELTFTVDKEKVVYKITEDLLIEEKFFQLKPIDYIQYQSFINKLPFDYLLFISMKYLEKKIRTEKEIKDYLLEHTNDVELIDRVISTLQKKQLINDKEFQKTYLDYAIKIKRDGRLKIFNSLSLVGVRDSFIYPEEDLKNNIEFLTLKFNEQNQNITFIKKIEKAKQYLLSKGYTDSDIEKYFHTSLISSEDERSLFKRELEKIKRKTKDIQKIKYLLLKKGFSIKLIDSILEA